MRKGLILLFLAANGMVIALSSPAFPASVAMPTLLSDTDLVPAHSAIPSPEEFINQVFHTVVDSSFSKYYLYAEATPCGFVKYDYDEWIKYHLVKDVPIYTLNELAGKCYHDRKLRYWRQDNLVKASCISTQKMDSILNPYGDLVRPSSPAKAQEKAVMQKEKAIAKMPAEEKVVFHFSRPEFTDDGQYAIVDLGFTCGPLCGRSVTYLFRREGTGDSNWKMIGKRLNWVS
jgi:hypothetical protein